MLSVMFWVFFPEFSSDEANGVVVKKRRGRPRLYPEGFAQHQKKLRQAAKEERLFKDEAGTKEMEDIKIVERTEKERTEMWERMKNEDMIMEERARKAEKRMVARMREAGYSVEWLEIRRIKWLPERYEFLSVANDKEQLMKMSWRVEPDTPLLDNNTLKDLLTSPSRRESGSRRKLPSATEGFDLSSGRKTKVPTEEVSFNRKIDFYRVITIL